MIQPRPPIVTILGHVDHGKTTLLDFLRKSNIAARETGGITQHTRSFQLITPNSSPITFIDTPGHAAFSHMRARGSRIADLALLVVSSDDGVMPQTKESLEFIKSTSTSFIVTLTKSDLSSANPDKVKTQLTEIGVVVEDFGGDIPAVSVSAKTGAGVSDLLELIDLVTKLDPPQADPQAQLEAVVLESRLDSQKGPLATVIVKNGTLSIGQSIFSQDPVGKVRALLNSEGENIKTALPSTPVEILGLTSVLQVGSTISDRPTNGTLQPITENRKLATSKSDSTNLILRADVAGSLEAILAAFPSDVSVVYSGTGDITESDVLLAVASHAQIIGFNVKTPTSVAKLAETEKVFIHSHRIIYELLDQLDKLIHPIDTEIIHGQAEIVAEFKYGPDRVAGCHCIQGLISKVHPVKLMRGSELVGSTRLKSLKQNKLSVDKIKVGGEFGAVFSPHLDFKVGDIIISCSSNGQA